MSDIASSGHLLPPLSEQEVAILLAFFFWADTVGYYVADAVARNRHVSPEKNNLLNDGCDALTG
jgi:hypothetical protein